MEAVRRLSVWAKGLFSRLASFFKRRSPSAARGRGDPGSESADEEWIEEEAPVAATAIRERRGIGELRPFLASRAFALILALCAGILVMAIAVSALLSRPLPSMPPLAEGVDFELFSSFTYPEAALPYAGMEALTPMGSLPEGYAYPARPDTAPIADLARRGRAEVEDYLEAVE